MHLAYQTTCIDCLPFCLYNLSSDTGRLTSFHNNNKVIITNPDGSREYLCLGRQQILEIAIQPGAKLNSKFFLFGSGEGQLNQNSQFEFVPEHIASDSAGFNVSRTGAPNVRLFSLTATTADIFFNDTLQNTITLIPGQVVTYIAPTVNGNYFIQADGDFIGQKTAGNANDSGTFFRPADDIIGWASTAAFISSNPGGSPFDAYHVNTNGATSQNANNPSNTLNFNDFGNFNNTQDEYYEPTSAIRIRGTGLYGQSRGDSDGGDDTAIIPLEFMGDTHVIAHPAEFISAVSDQPAAINVTEADGTTSILNLTRGANDPFTPYSGRLGTNTNTANFDAGLILESDVPIHVVYQVEDGLAFASDTEETISFGYNKN